MSQKGAATRLPRCASMQPQLGIDLTQICFMGDDVNDLPAMRIAGCAAAPANASKDVLAQADFIAKKCGGNGAVRELIDALLSARGLRAEEVFN